MALAVTVLVGWVKNLIHLFTAGLDAGVTAEFVLRCIGIFIAPIGAIFGFFF